MPIVLSLLGPVRWNTQTVVGYRSQALLAALAETGRVVRPETLIDRIWGEDTPAAPAKALQVLVSRTRSACSPEAVVRDGAGYRLGIAPAQVDSARLSDLATAARVALTRDPATAQQHAREALEIGSSLIWPDDAEGPLAQVRGKAAADLRATTIVLARAASRLGDHAEELPNLEVAVIEHPDDESLLIDLLRSESVVRGPSAALERYEAYRCGLRDRLGSDPGPELQQLHAELLAQDNPVREGIHQDATSLLGRERDIRQLHAILNTSRVVSILGPGGLGKTRLAHVVGRNATQPVVHFVELVGISDPEDLIGEVGAVLGVRDSISGRRTLTPAQQADVRGRIAQHLDQSASLLILDNCEHIVAAVADLVAYLVATTRTLHVLTTTRSPLTIPAEVVYPLSELSPNDAVELFRQRALAVRPGVHIDDAVNDIVRRLDGLPLAIELAAAKVRVMSVADIARRLEDRFALLRGGDRSAPDRHQTLLAVIDWSWHLMAHSEQHALRWLSVFHDGFTLDAADAVLGPDALDAVDGLAEQSMISVVESNDGIRYRMLETVREFGRLQLAQASEADNAEAAQRRWAVDLCRRQRVELFGRRQIEAVDALRVEENNLADLLRQALTGDDPETVVELLSALGTYWSIVGDHARVIVLVAAITQAVDGWSPPAGLADATRLALVMTLNNAVIGGAENTTRIRSFLGALGPGRTDSKVAAMVQVALSFDPSRSEDLLDTMEQFSRSDDRHLAIMAEQMRSHALENLGDPAAGTLAAEHALSLVHPDDGPWTEAILRTQVAQFLVQHGDLDGAVAHARKALPTLERLGALDDAVQLRSWLVLAAVGAGELDRAQRELDQLGAIDVSTTVFGGGLYLELCEAELALARGEVERGLELYGRGVNRARAITIPGVRATGSEPWAAVVEAAALTVYAHYGKPDAPLLPAGLAQSCQRRTGAILDPHDPHIDFPVAGLLLFALGTWGLLRDQLSALDAVRLLVLADRFAYLRTVPTTDWNRIVNLADARHPGLIDQIQDEYGTRAGPELLDEARRFVEELGWASHK